MKIYLYKYSTWYSTIALKTFNMQKLTKTYFTFDTSDVQIKSVSYLGCPRI